MQTEVVSLQPENDWHPIPAPGAQSLAHARQVLPHLAAYLTPFSAPVLSVVGKSISNDPGMWPESGLKKRQVRHQGTGSSELTPAFRHSGTSFLVSHSFPRALLADLRFILRWLGWEIPTPSRQRQ